MSIIGRFTPDEAGYVGTITTLTLRARSVRFTGRTDLAVTLAT